MRNKNANVSAVKKGTWVQAERRICRIGRTEDELDAIGHRDFEYRSGKCDRGGCVMQSERSCLQFGA